MARVALLVGHVVSVLHRKDQIEANLPHAKIGWAVRTIVHILLAETLEPVGSKQEPAAKANRPCCEYPSLLRIFPYSLMSRVFRRVFFPQV